jgi:hypothetical protein
MKNLNLKRKSLGFYKRLIIHLLNAAILILFINANCNKNDILSPEDSDITNESAFSRSTTEIQKVLSNSNSYMIMVANNVSSIPGSCPSVSINKSSGSITVNYGSSPCINNTDSIRRSGSYTINYYISTGGDSLAASIIFNNYNVYKVKGISGDNSYVTITGLTTINTKKIITQEFPLYSNYQSTFYTDVSFTKSTGGVKAITLTMNANVIINNPQVFTDYSFYITGSGTLTNQNSNITYSYSIDTGFPVTLETSCQYPLSGKVYMDLNSDRFTVDFSPYNSSCDDVATITKFGVVKYINLSSVDF